MPDHPETLIELRVTAMRRYAGVAVLLGLGCVLVYVALNRAPGPALQALMAAGGIAAFYGARGVWRATSSAVVLSAEGLHDADGTPIAPLDLIEKVDGGFLAFRPSNGFTVRLRTAQPTGWRPGLWWRYGTRIGIGGMTPRQPGKMMAAALNEMVHKKGPHSDAGRAD